MAISIFLIWFVGSDVPSELAPLEDKGRLTVNAIAPEGTSFERMDDYVSELIQMADTIEGKEALIAVTAPGFGAASSVNSGFMRIMLNDPPETEARASRKLQTTYSAKFRNMTFARTFVITGADHRARAVVLPVQFVIQAPDFEKLKDYPAKVYGESQCRSGFPDGRPQPEVQ